MPDYKNPHYWEDLSKPWSVEDCEYRYVFGKRIGLKTLAGLAGVNDKTINTWSFQREWVRKRQEFMSDLQTKVKTKVVDQQSTELANALTQIEIEHADTLKYIRNIAMEYFKAVRMVMDRAEANDDPEEMMRAIAFDKFDRMSLAVTRLIECERKALHLETTDINVAIKIVESAGMKVALPESSTDVEFAEVEE